MSRMSRACSADHGPAIAWQPPPELVAARNARVDELKVPDFDALIARPERKPECFGAAVAGRLDCYRPRDKPLDISAGIPFARCCVGGRTDVASIQHPTQPEGASPAWH